MAKYTFLMPAYKAAFIRDSIQSILNQTYTDFQLIVSDDCSPEGLKAIVDEFDDDRIIYRRNEKNIGAERLVDHWNLLLNLTESDYIILSPDDDIYSPRFLEEIDKLTLRYPGINVLKARSQKTTETGEAYEKDMLYEEVISQLDNIYHQTLPNHISGIGNYVFKAKALKYIGGFKYYPYAWWSDVMTNIILSKDGMAVTKDILFSFRQFKQSISSRHCDSKESRAKADATFTFCKDIKGIINTMNIPSTEYNNNCIYKWEKFLMGERWYYLQFAVAYYKLKELHAIMKANNDIFSSSYNKYIFLKSWLLKKKCKQ